MTQCNSYFGLSKSKMTVNELAMFVFRKEGAEKKKTTKQKKTFNSNVIIELIDIELIAGQ